MKVNFHTHHQLCQHANGTCQDYVEEALRQEFTELGFSDHAPFDEMNLGYRMKDSDFPIYIKDITDTKMMYSSRLTIKAGIEIEHWYTKPGYYDRFLPYLDYMILGQHFISLKKNDKNLISSFGLWNPEQLQCYADTLCDAMRTGRFQIIAHPELFMHGYKDFDEHATRISHQIIQCASKTDTILEFNANGYRRAKIETPQGYVHPYPRIEFWKIIEQYDVRTILSSDCHGPTQIYDNIIKEAEEVYMTFDVKRVTIFDELRSKNR